MTYALGDTIAAIATAAGGAARGIVRISGPQALDCLASCFRGEPVSNEPAGRPHLRVGIAIVTFDDGISADQRHSQGELPCTAYVWPTRRSYTREPVVELHTIGSPPLLDALLRTVCRHGARLAEPGEFTLRAFLAGRLDLVQAEAVLGVIDAASARQLETALAQLSGGLTGPLGELRESLLDLLADLEAGLDFVEEDISFVSAAELIARLDTAAGQVAELVHRMTTRGTPTGRPRAVLAGLPNAGKSRLFNALAGAERAIVSSQPGTTRDYLTAVLDLDGLECELIDTAGVDDDAQRTSSPANLAQQATAQQSRQADLEILCLDSTRPLNAGEGGRLTAAGEQLMVLTKIDAAGERCVLGAPTAVIATSAVTGAGLSLLRGRLREAVLRSSEPTSAVASTAVRCRESLQLAAECLRRAQSAAAQSAGDELVASELRVALTELGKVAGTVYTDDVLDRIFSRFCIGK